MKSYYAVVDVSAEYADKYPFKNGDDVLVLSEIETMPGHVVVATRDGQLHFPYHEENFRKLSHQEV